MNELCYFTGVNGSNIGMLPEFWTTIIRSLSSIHNEVLWRCDNNLGANIYIYIHTHTHIYIYPYLLDPGNFSGPNANPGFPRDVGETPGFFRKITGLEEKPGFFPIQADDYSGTRLERSIGKSLSLNTEKIETDSIYIKRCRKICILLISKVKLDRWTFNHSIQMKYRTYDR